MRRPVDWRCCDTCPPSLDFVPKDLSGLGPAIRPSYRGDGHDILDDLVLPLESTIVGGMDELTKKTATINKLVLCCARACNWSDVLSFRRQQLSRCTRNSTPASASAKKRVKPSIRPAKQISATWTMATRTRTRKRKATATAPPPGRLQQPALPLSGPRPR